MQSVSSRIFCALLRAVFHSSLVNNRKLSDNAGKATKDAVSRYKASKGFEHTRHECGNAFYEKLVCKDCKTDKIVLHLHGGSFKVKLIDMYRKISEKYSRMVDGATVISLDYRIFPEHRFPSQLEDAVCVYKMMLEKGTPPENIIFIGDSAGATLALALALWLRDNGCPLPGHIVCFSLWGDATSSGASRIKNAYRDPFGGIAKRKKIEDNLDYLRGISKYAQELDRTNPYVSPCFGSFDGFPPVTLVCGEAEMDESDNDTVYEKMKSIGIDAKLYKFDGMFHDFQFFEFLPESRRAFDAVEKRLRGEQNENS